MSPPSERARRHRVRLTPREALLFEAGIKLGGIFHQYIGVPVSPRTSRGLSHAIEDAVRLQPFVTSVRIRIDPRLGPPQGRGRFAYRYLTGEMLRATVTLSDGSTEVSAILEPRRDLSFPLMSVARVRTHRARGSRPLQGRRA